MRGEEHTRFAPIHNTMAGIKRKSAVASVPEVKSKSKKVKTDKPSSKTDSKHAVKPAKKSKRKEESPELEESDTSEQENGFYGFSANEDVEMQSAEEEGMEADSSENAMEDVKKTGKPAKSAATEHGDGSESKLASLNGRHDSSLEPQHMLIMSQPTTHEKPTPNRKHLQKSAKPRSQTLILLSDRRSFGRS